MYRGQIGLKVKIPQSGLVLEHIVYASSGSIRRSSELITAPRLGKSNWYKPKY